MIEPMICTVYKSPEVGTDTGTDLQSSCLYIKSIKVCRLNTLILHLYEIIKHPVKNHSQKSAAIEASTAVRRFFTRFKSRSEVG